MHRFRTGRWTPRSTSRAGLAEWSSNRRGVRRWRKRGERGQVAPVATILGLLLVVTFIANYLTATLPGQMSANDLNHELLLENQLGQFSALLPAVSATGITGAQVSQPISLGTASQPPFAGADHSVLSRGNLTGGITVSYSVTGPGPTTQTISNTGMPGASVLVHAQNTYATPSDVAYDQGAVIYAQPGGQPIMIDSPSISLANGALSIWVPSFQGTPTTESGIASAEVYARLIAYTSLSYPVNGFSLTSGSSVTLTVVTPYPSVWVSFFNALPSSATASCAGVRSVCTSAYQSSGPSATVTIALTGVTSLTVDYATFGVSFG
jgi:hypothetical protein